MSLDGATSAIASSPGLIHKLMKPEQTKKNKPFFYTFKGESSSGHPE